MRAAIVRVSVFTLECPWCGGDIAQGNQCEWPQEFEIPCTECNLMVRVPHARIHKLWQPRVRAAIAKAEGRKP